MVKTPLLSAFLLALVLGLRHGIDWDHIAAISDITGTAKNKKHGLILGFLYAVGHASVIIILGLLAIVVGIKLPHWIDNVVEPFVGITLITLGIWLFYSIVRYGAHFRRKSRWMLLFSFFNKFSDFLHNRFAHDHNLPHIHLPETYGRKTAFTVGMIHGIGAETPTQVLLFITAAGVGGSKVGSALLFFFVLGLIISNTIISGLSTAGFMKASHHSKLNIILGLLTAIFSLIVGSIFLFGKSAVLPAIFGG